ncbi:MAG: FAD-dependent monooxygenase [Acidobacteriota bacterium]
MKINIIGGGPAGLYFAILMKKLDPACRIAIMERDGPNDTFGWGIVFSDQTFSYLRDNDFPSFNDIITTAEVWDNVDVVHRDEKVSIHGNRFSGIARLAFLNILHKRCRELEVDLRFHSNVTDIKSVADCDLLVGADGANSLVRRAYADFFQPSVDLRKNKYIWLGTHHLFHGLTLTFRHSEVGLFIAHSYKFNKSTSTFIVECNEDVWKRAGLDQKSDAETCEYLAEVFRKDLNEEPLLANNFVRWLNFPLVKNARWYHDNVVLLGDALHTAHFSIGSGTKLALEDSIALADCFRKYSDVARALAEFERVRKPVVDSIQEAAFSSLLMFENAADDMHLDALPLAYKLMTRSKRIDYEKLRKRDPQFIRDYDDWVRSHGG